jgi:hypothetical protein
MKETIKDFECVYVYRTGKKIHKCIFKACDEDQAKTHFKFFYPRRILKKIKLKKI